MLLMCRCPGKSNEIAALFTNARAGPFRRSRLTKTSTALEIWKFSCFSENSFACVCRLNSSLVSVTISNENTFKMLKDFARDLWGWRGLSVRCKKEIKLGWVTSRENSPVGLCWWAPMLNVCSRIFQLVQRFVGRDGSIGNSSCDGKHFRGLGFQSSNKRSETSRHATTDA